jgi:hypothetical protein
MPKTVVGIMERVTLVGNRNVSTDAVFDTGARLTSIDIRLASKARVGPIIRTTRVKNPSTKMVTKRPVVGVEVKIKGKVYQCEANLQDRSHMTANMLIGRNVLAGRFIVDPSKNLKRFEAMQKRKNGAKMMGLKSIMDFSSGNGDDR